MKRQSRWLDLLEDFEKIRGTLGKYQARLIDEDTFIGFIGAIRDPDHARFRPRPRYGRERRSIKNIDVTGYFSAGITKDFTNLQKRGCKIRLVSPHFNLNSRADKANLGALRRMSNSGIQIRISSRMHARIYVGYSTPEEYNGILLLGSFDFNREGLSGQNRNLGIITQNPDLIEQTVEWFNKIWNDEIETTALDDAYPE